MKVIVKNARLGFADLFKAKSISGGKPRFSATLIMSDDTKLKVKDKEGKPRLLSHDKMKGLVEGVVKEKFGGKVPAKLKQYVYCKADGSVGARDPYVNEDGDYWAGFDENTWFIVANKNEEQAVNGQITVVDQHKDDIASNSGKIFSGCYVNAVIDIYAMEGEEGKMVTASLEGIQLLKKGEALGLSQIDAKSEFDEEEMDEDDEIGDDGDEDDDSPSSDDELEGMF